MSVAVGVLAGSLTWRVARGVARPASAQVPVAVEREQASPASAPEDAEMQLSRERAIAELSKPGLLCDCRVLALAWLVAVAVSRATWPTARRPSPHRGPRTGDDFRRVPAPGMISRPPPGIPALPRRSRTRGPAPGMTPRGPAPSPPGPHRG